jgi:amidase
MAGHEPGDRHRAPAAPCSFAEAARSQAPRTRIRLALAAPFGVVVDDEPRAAALRAAEALAALGHDVAEGAPAWDDESFAASWAIYLTGVAQHLLRVVERLHGCSVDADQLEPATRAWLVDSPPVPLIDYLEAGERLFEFARRILGAWREDEVLVTPTLTRLPTPVGTIRSRAGVTDDAVRYSAFVRLWNVTGQPALSLPLGQAADGTPVGVQLVGPPGGEGLLLSLAAQLEQAIGWPTVAPASIADPLPATVI